MNKTLISLSFLLLFTGCSLMPNLKSSPEQVLDADVGELYNEFCRSYEEKYICAVGIGAYPSEAEKRAKERLAETVLTFVHTSFEEWKKRIEDKFGKRLFAKEKAYQEFTSLNASFLEAEGLRIIKRGKDESSGLYYAVAVLDKKKAETSAKKFQKKAKAMWYATLIERINEPAVKLYLLSELEKEIETKNLGEEIISVGGELKTLDTFVEEVLTSLKDSLTVIFSGSRVFLVDKNSLHPVGGVELAFEDSNGRRGVYFTADDGSIQLPSAFSLPVNVFIRLGKKKCLLASLGKKETSNIYIATSPNGVVYDLWKGNEVISTATTPNVVSVRPSGEEERYTVVIKGGAKYREIKDKIIVKRGFDAYFWRKLETIRYGKLELEVEGDAVLEISTLDGRVVADDVDKFEGQVPAGSYTVLVKRRDDSEKYQIVEDSFTVTERGVIKRKYFEPKDRNFRRWGWGGYIGFTIQEPEKVENVPSSEEEDSVPFFVFGGRKYWTHFYLGGDFGLAGQDSESSKDYSGLCADAVGGIYFWDGKFEIGVGYQWGKVTYSYSDYDYDNWEWVEKKATLSFNRPFLDLKFNLSILWLEGRISKNAKWIVIGLGGSEINSGYSLKRKIKAVKGRDYE